MRTVVLQSQQMTQQGRRRFAGRLLLLVAVSSALMALSSAPAYAITRSQVLARAQTWVDARVPYSQSASYPDTTTGYRTDCSGYVSMAWKITSSSGAPLSYTTSTLGQVSHQIAAAELQPGDAVLRAGSHVRLFGWWTDASHTTYVSFEESHSGTNASRYVQNIVSDVGYGYVPVRYNRIEDEPPPSNVLQNWSFEVWTNGKPDSWTFTTDSAGTASQRNDWTHSGWSALGLTDPTADPARFAQVQQSVAALPNRSYTLAAWAISDRNPDGVQMRLQFLDATGASLAETYTTGARWATDFSGSMSQLILPSVSPSGTARATVTLRLCGGSWIGPGGGAGGSAVLDDVWLAAATPVPVWRFYNVRTGTHFYTADPAERDRILATMGATYHLDGPAWNVNTASPLNSTPLYRFYNLRTGTHFYTASDSEKNMVLTTMASTYHLDGPAYYVSLSPVDADPVFRFYNPRTGTHFYTASIAERDSVIAKLAGTLHYEGTAYYLAR